MAKRKVKKEVPLTRKQVSRRERERRQRLILISIAAFIGFLIVGILAFGFYMERVVTPASPVALVNGVAIRTDTYQERVRLERMRVDSALERLAFQKSQLDPEQDQFLVSYVDQQLSQLAMTRAGLDGEDFLNRLIEEELIRQAAEEKGVVVSDEEVDRMVEEDFGYDRDAPTPVPSPTMAPGAATPEATPAAPVTGTAQITPTVAPTPMTQAGFEELYDQFLSALRDNAGMSDADFKKTIEAELLRQKMGDVVGEEVSTSEPQVQARHILVETREEAEAVLERLDGGEDFASLAEELSQDPGSAQGGGDLGWFPRGVMAPEFEEGAFSLSPGEISDVVETTFGFHIIEVEEQDDNRELEPDILAQKREQAFQVWLADLEAAATIQRHWSVDKVPPE
jgi:parvulin-like peptidyl-prolyl isomerase